MPSLEQFKKNKLIKGNTIGRIHKWESDTIMEYSWDTDIQSCIGFMYDYFHDDEPEIHVGLQPYKSSSKIPVDVKLIMNAYNSDAKDQPSLHIQFKPSYTCNVDYYEEVFERKYGATFPVGLYIDLPDETGIYRRWLITEPADVYNKSFKKYSVLPVNYKFQWVEDNGTERYLRQMWGVEKLRNSYNSGIWADYLSSSVENQSQFLVPLNSISENLYYNQRMIVSAPIKTPITWQISKIENTKPLGINKVTLFQDRFNPDFDYVNLKTKEMYANYYKSEITPVTENSVGVIEDGEFVPKVNSGYLKLTTYQLKVGGSYRVVTLLKSEQDDTIVNVNLNTIVAECDGIDITDKVQIVAGSAVNKFKIKFLGGNEYLAKLITLKVSDTSSTVSATTQLEIVSL